MTDSMLNSAEGAHAAREQKGIVWVLYPDILRVFAIWMVILLHVTAPFMTDAARYGTVAWKFCIVLAPVVRTGVPLFFMLSGFLLLRMPQTRDIKQFYKTSLTRLILPLLTWNVVYFIWHIYNEGQEASVGAFVKQLLFTGTAYHMWFMYSMIAIYLIAPFLAIMTEKCSSRALALLVLIVFFFSTVRHMVNDSAGLYIDGNMSLDELHVGFFLLGYILGTVDFSRAQRWIIYLLGIAGFICGIAGNLAASGPGSIKLPMNEGYMWINYATASAVFVLARYLFSEDSRAAKSSRFRNTARRLSSVTFGVYWIHVLFLDIISKNILYPENPVTVSIICIFLLTAALSYAAAFLMSHTGRLKRFLM
ncbi:MAG: acyltransferase family protein [Anaerovoracaceae bacterium]|nr:acyltransferase family protein [Bacillota bacterium]MDY2670804.1 acyltransferase family protein [Anaerovoracaceae bacterium]